MRAARRRPNISRLRYLNISGKTSSLPGAVPSLVRLMAFNIFTIVKTSCSSLAWSSSGSEGASKRLLTSAST
jgi:hypothetical protein